MQLKALSDRTAVDSPRVRSQTCATEAHGAPSRPPPNGHGAAGWLPSAQQSLCGSVVARSVAP
eukprot:14555686-Alexandrium_andersonii.AAC.1